MNFVKHLNNKPITFFYIIISFPTETQGMTKNVRTQKRVSRLTFQNFLFILKSNNGFKQ